MRSSKRGSKRGPAPLAAWGRKLADFRRSVGFDFMTPEGFSEYLLAVYGKGAPEEFNGDPLAQLVSQDAGLDVASGRWGQRVDSVFDTWVRAMAPDGMLCARGLHGLGFLPGDNIAKMIFSARDQRGREWATKKEDPVSYYSMNIPVAVAHFATGYVTRGYPELSDMWTRAASQIEPDAGEFQMEPGREYGSLRLSPSVGQLRDARLPPRVKRAFYQTQCPVVIVSRASRSMMIGFGGDSESGDTNEAEIYLRHCEPRCVERIFVASTYRLGAKVDAKTRRYYALDEHIEIGGRNIEYWGVPKLTLHPDSSVSGGRLVRNLPDEWTWYEVG